MTPDCPAQRARRGGAAVPARWWRSTAWSEWWMVGVPCIRFGSAPQIIVSGRFTLRLLVSVCAASRRRDVNSAKARPPYQVATSVKLTLLWSWAARRGETQAPVGRSNHPLHPRLDWSPPAQHQAEPEVASTQPPGARSSVARERSVVACASVSGWSRLRPQMTPPRAAPVEDGDWLSLPIQP